MGAFLVGQQGLIYFFAVSDADNLDLILTSEQLLHRLGENPDGTRRCLLYQYITGNAVFKGKQHEINRFVEIVNTHQRFVLTSHVRPDCDALGSEQAMRGILPNAANEVISLFKGTSIVSTMAIAELFYQVQVIYGRNGRVVPLLMVATVWYILMTTVLSIVQYYVERHYAKGAVRTMPLTPLQKVRRRVALLSEQARQSSTIGAGR